MRRLTEIVRVQPETTRPLTSEEQTFAVKTWRYLRLAMVGLVGGLAVSVAYEWAAVSDDCVQTSISGYFYTHAQAYFVGALVAIGVCMFCLKGNTESEDVLLNLAGMFAPIVAFVPTTDRGSCTSITVDDKDIHLNVTNNVTALVVVGAVALLILAVVAKGRAPSRAALVGYVVAGAVWLIAALAILVDRDLFVRKAHYAAAALMFACIIAVVWRNAVDYQESGPATSLRNRYAFVAWGMGCSLVLIPLGQLWDWPYWVIVLEGLLIALFALFWVIQTKELWKKGLR